MSLSRIPICTKCLKKREGAKFCLECGSRILLHMAEPLRAHEISALASEIAYYGCLNCGEHKASSILDDVYLAEEIAEATYDFGSCAAGNRYREPSLPDRLHYGAQLDEYALRLIEMLDAVGRV